MEAFFLYEAVYCYYSLCVLFFFLLIIKKKTKPNRESNISVASLKLDCIRIEMKGFATDRPVQKFKCLKEMFSDGQTSGC